jgi:glycolate oxidase iron-sulfur subunit
VTEPKPPLLPQYAHLKKEYDAVVQCNRCGFCETACPTYAATGNETLSPRGRNQAFRQILEGSLKDPRAAAEAFSTCLTCQACTAVCFSQVPVARLMGEARAVAGSAPSWPVKSLLRTILLHRRLMSLLIGTGAFFKKIGVSFFLRKIGLLRRISPELDAADALVETAPVLFGGGPAESSGTGPAAAYFSGCGMHYAYAGATKDFVRTLSASSRSLTCPSHACCGLIAQSAGDVEGARRLARKNIERFKDAERIVTDDDSCCGFMKSYGTLLEGDPDAERFAGKVKNLGEYLAETGLPAPFSAERPKIRVTYHDPCQMGNGHQSYASPRKLLKALPGVEFVELEESNVCCGGAGTYCLKHPDLADAVLEKKLENIRKSGAQVVVTQASSCLLHVGYGLRRKGWDIRVMHLAEFLQDFEKKRI